MTDGTSAPNHPPPLRYSTLLYQHALLLRDYTARRDTSASMTKLPHHNQLPPPPQESLERGGCAPHPHLVRLFGLRSQEGEAAKITPTRPAQLCHTSLHCILDCPHPPFTLRFSATSQPLLTAARLARSGVLRLAGGGGERAGADHRPALQELAGRVACTPHMHIHSGVPAAVQTREPVRARRSAKRMVFAEVRQETASGGRERGLLLWSPHFSALMLRPLLCLLEWMPQSR
jgi:hypothetical protein